MIGELNFVGRNKCFQIIGGGVIVLDAVPEPVLRIKDPVSPELSEIFPVSGNSQAADNIIMKIKKYLIILSFISVLLHIEKEIIRIGHSVYHNDQGQRIYTELKPAGICVRIQGN